MGRLLSNPVGPYIRNNFTEDRLIYKVLMPALSGKNLYCYHWTAGLSSTRSEDVSVSKNKYQHLVVDESLSNNTLDIVVNSPL